LVSFELARKVSKLALQIHGGYGYFEDFKIEKFYRDSMALTVLFGNYLSDRTKISKYLIDQTSAEY
jgi:Acyl-CoA dehydrogenases